MEVFSDMTMIRPGTSVNAIYPNSRLCTKCSQVYMLLHALYSHKNQLLMTN